MDHLVIGVDCSTDESKVGLAAAWHTSLGLQLAGVAGASATVPAVSTICQWLDGVTDPVLLALDAPLGWPKSLAASLQSHVAGQIIETEPNLMFRRETDRFIQRTLKKTPLDVGADRIARTAHAALRLLGILRLRLGAEIPLAWGRFSGLLAAVEVYPAATLKARGFRADGYKNPTQAAARADIKGECESPVDEVLARREGWIWVKARAPYTSP